jgi:23S rRNA pseudouridine1911/1915/1917 synthase
MEIERNCFFRTPFSDLQSPELLGIFEDFLVVYKPIGMHSVPQSNSQQEGSSFNVREDLVSWLGQTMPEQKKIFSCSERSNHKDRRERSYDELGMLSRLDRETSGIVLFACNPESFEKAMMLQRSQSVYKYYHLHVSETEKELAGAKPTRGILSLSPTQDSQDTNMYSIESRFRSFGKKSAKVSCISTDATGTYDHKRLSRDSYTTYLQRKAPGACTSILDESRICFKAMIFKGFRHQIRAHMAWIGMPIVGDQVYGGAPAQRLFLEACHIDIHISAVKMLSLSLYGDNDVDF